MAVFITPTSLLHEYICYKLITTDLFISYVNTYSFTLPYYNYHNYCTQLYTILHIVKRRYVVTYMAS